MKKRIPLSVPEFNEREYHYVTEAIKDNWVSTSGDYIRDFEGRLAEYLGVRDTVACQSGTAAIHLALLLAGVQREHEVIVPALSFIATVNPVKYIGADPVFMDCDDSLNMDIEKLEEFCDNHCYLTDEGLKNKVTNKLITAIVVVHIFGNLMDMERLMLLARKYRLKVIEDATEALGGHYLKGKYKGKFAGTIGDYGAFSFNGNKIITTGGGGLLVCKRMVDTEKGRYLSNQAKDDPVNYVHNEIGYNYRMTNVQAAIGLGQLEKLEDYISIKTKNYIEYKNAIKDIDGLDLLKFNSDARNNYWFYPLIVDEEVYGISNMELLKILDLEDIQSRPVWGLLCYQNPYKDNIKYLINRSRYYRARIINIPCSVGLTKLDLMRVVEVLKNNSR